MCHQCPALEQDGVSVYPSVGQTEARSMKGAEFPSEQRHGLYRAIYERRDIRAFRDQPVPPETLARIIRAAHNGPSVGFMQPWDFILVSDVDTRVHVKRLFDRERQAAAQFFDESRRSQYLSLKLEGIMEAPVNICVTCDPTRGEEVLGRNSMPETDVYSTCCAVQNLWLSARAEGVGVGWVSILKLPQLRRILGIPPHIVPVAYLCLGYPVEFPPVPLLETAGWRDRLPLDDLVHYEGWGKQPEPGIWDEVKAALASHDSPQRPAKEILPLCNRQQISS